MSSGKKPVIPKETKRAQEQPASPPTKKKRARSRPAALDIDSSDDLEMGDTI